MMNPFFSENHFFRSEKAIGPARAGRAGKKNRKIWALRTTGPVAGIRHRARVARYPAPG